MEGGEEMAESGITLAGIITDAQSMITAAGAGFKSLETNFGAVLLIPVTITIAKTIIRTIKSVLMYRGGRKR